MNRGGNCTTSCMYLVPQNCTLKNGEDDKFCYVYFNTKYFLKVCQWAGPKPPFPAKS